MAEKRRATRHELRDSLLVTDMDKGEKLGNLINLSPHGMLIKSESPLDIGRKMELGLHLATTIFGKEYLIVEAQCVWVRADDDSQYYLCGFEFVEVSTQDANIILGLIMDQRATE